MLYTRKGDSGTSKVLNKEGRIDKDSLLFEALGNCDELNSWLGVCKASSKDLKGSVLDLNIYEIVDKLQQDLFIIQAELAGADMSIKEEKVLWLEEITNTIEEKLPKIESFFVPGGSKVSAWFDVARTVTRRVERSLVRAINADEIKVTTFTLQYLNRLSSVLYALVRFSNMEEDVLEKKPNYL